MNKLLITGMVVGMDSGVCQCYNYDFDWLVLHPSVLVWADKILVTKTAWDVIQEGVFPDPPAMAKCCGLVMSIARDRGLVEVREPSLLLDEGLRDAIRSQAERDLDRITSVFSERVRPRDISANASGTEGMTETTVDGVGYCIPYVGSIYSSLALAREWGANCLFDHHAVSYLRLKFGISAPPPQAGVGKAEGFAKVFEAHFPDERLMPSYAFSSEGRCVECPKSEACRDSYLGEVEDNAARILYWRDRDEVRQIKAVIGKIVDALEKTPDSVDPAEVAREFETQRKALMRKMRSVLPRVERWSSVATLASIPVAILGQVLGAPLLSAPIIASGAVAESVRLLESKWRWVGFLQERLGDGEV